MTACRRSGRYKVPHFDAKGEANHLFTDAGVPTTLLNTSFYWENLIYFGMGPQPGTDGTLAITFPLGDAKLAGIAAGDIGGCAYGTSRPAVSSSARRSASPEDTSAVRRWPRV